MNIGDRITCEGCGEELFVDAFDIEDGCVLCLVCGEFVEIRDEEDS